MNRRKILYFVLLSDFLKVYCKKLILCWSAGMGQKLAGLVKRNRYSCVGADPLELSDVLAGIK